MKYGVPAGATNVNNVSWWWPGEKYRYVLVYRANENERGDNDAKKINWCGVPHISLVRARGGSWSWRMHEDILAEKEQRIVKVVMVVVVMCVYGGGGGGGRSSFTCSDHPSSYRGKGRIKHQFLIQCKQNFDG